MSHHTKAPNQSEWGHLLLASWELLISWTGKKSEKVSGSTNTVKSAFPSQIISRFQCQAYMLGQDGLWLKRKWRASACGWLDRMSFNKIHCLCSILLNPAVAVRCCFIPFVLAPLLWAQPLKISKAMLSSFNLSDWFKPAVSTISTVLLYIWSWITRTYEHLVWNKTVQSHWNHIEGQRCPEDLRLHAFGLLSVNRICVYAYNLSFDVRLRMYMEIQRQSWWWSIWGHLATSWFLSFMSSPGCQF